MTANLALSVAVAALLLSLILNAVMIRTIRRLSREIMEERRSRLLDQAVATKLRNCSADVENEP